MLETWNVLLNSFRYARDGAHKPRATNVTVFFHLIGIHKEIFSIFKFEHYLLKYGQRLSVIEFEAIKQNYGISAFEIRRQLKQADKCTMSDGMRSDHTTVGFSFSFVCFLLILSADAFGATNIYRKCENALDNGLEMGFGGLSPT